MTMPGMNFSPEQISRLMKAGGFAGLGSGAFNLFGGAKNPYDAASPYLDKAEESTKNYFRPYVNTGLNAMTDLTGRYQQLLNDPGSIMAQLGKGFKTSPGYDFNKQQALTGINNAAAAGGMLGTNQHQQQSGELAENLANKEYSDYFRNALGLYDTGLEGEHGQEAQGFQASNNLANMIASILMNKGNLAFSGTAAGNEKQGSGLSDLLSGAALLYGA